MLRSVYNGILDGEGNGFVPVPEVQIDHMPLVVAYTNWDIGIFAAGYAQAQFTFPSEGELKIWGRSSSANQPFAVVVLSGPELIRHAGRLDENGQARISAPELQLDELPLIACYVERELEEAPTFTNSCSLELRAGEVRLQAWPGVRHARFRIVRLKSAALKVVSGTFSQEGSAEFAASGLDPLDPPLTLAYKFSSDAVGTWYESRSIRLEPTSGCGSCEIEVMPRRSFASCRIQLTTASLAQEGL